MDATCNVQDSIHVFHLVHNMCPGFWVHIIHAGGIFLCTKEAGTKVLASQLFLDCRARRSG